MFKLPEVKILLIGLLIAGAVFGWMRFGDEIAARLGGGGSDFLQGVSFGLEEEDGEPAGAGAPDGTDATSPGAPADRQYASAEYNFSFLYPEGFKLTEFSERGGYMVLVRSAEGEAAFQVFITPYDEPAESLTAERIHRDLPDLVMRDVGAFSFGETTAGRQVAGLTFISEGPPFDVSREVWFVRGGHLYQVSAYLADQDALQAVLRTWRFE